MAKNREELLKAAAEHAAQVKDEVRKTLSAFMAHANLRPADIAHMLGIDERVINGLLSGTGTIDVDTLAVMLVTMGLAVEIKPVGQTPLKRYAPGGPHSGGRPMPPYGHESAGVPLGRLHIGGDDSQMQRPQMPPRDANGRFARRAPQDMPPIGVGREGRQRSAQPIVRPQGDGSVPESARAELDCFVQDLEGMDENGLRDLISKNLWDGEIDVENAPREALIGFLADKAARKAAYDSMKGGIAIKQAKAPIDAENPEVHGEFSPKDAPVSTHSGEALELFDRLMNGLRTAMQRDSKLAEEVGTALIGRR